MRIVCFGGGNSITKAVIPAVMGKNRFLTTIASMADSGGSSGDLKKEFGVLPPGDLRRHMISLSKAPEWKKKIFDMRFGKQEISPGHRGHNLGNVIMASLEMSFKDYSKVINFLHEFLEIDGRCLPSTIESTELCAELESGEIVRGEAEIDMPVLHDPLLRIRRVFLAPPVNAYPEAISAIAKADIIIIGPGDLYSSLVACFLPKGMKEAMEKSKAIKIFICPAMTKQGETNSFTINDFTEEMEKYSGRVDYVIYNSKNPEKKRLNSYKKEHPEIDNIAKFVGDAGNKKFIGADLLNDSGDIVYDSKKVGKALFNLRKIKQLK